MAWYCSWCDVSFPEYAFSHRTLGPVCGRCMRPVQRRKSRPPSAVVPSRSRRQQKRSGAERMRRKLATVAERDGWVCQLCFGVVDPGVTSGRWMATLDHVIPLSAGGTGALANLQLAHKRCNGQRSSLPLDEWFAGRAPARAEPIAELSSVSDAARQKMQAMKR